MSFVRNTVTNFYFSLAKENDEKRKRLNSYFRTLFPEEKEFSSVEFKPLLKRKTTVVGTVTNTMSSAGSMLTSFISSLNTTPTPFFSFPEYKYTSLDRFLSFYRERQLCNNDREKIYLCRNLQFAKFIKYVNRKMSFYVENRGSFKTSYPDVQSIISCIENDFATSLEKNYLTKEEQLKVIAEVRTHYDDKYKFIFNYSAWREGVYPYRKIFALALIQIKLNELINALLATPDYSAPKSDRERINTLFANRDPVILKKYNAIREYRKFCVWLEKFSESEYVSPYFACFNDMLNMINSILNFDDIFEYLWLDVSILESNAFKITPSVKDVLMDLGHQIQNIQTPNPNREKLLKKINLLEWLNHRIAGEGLVQEFSGAIESLNTTALEEFLSENDIKKFINKLIAAINKDSPHVFGCGFFEKHNIQSEGMNKLKQDITSATNIIAPTRIIIDYLAPTIDDSVDMDNRTPRLKI